MACARAGPHHLVRQAARRALRVGRSRFHVGRRFSRRRRERKQFDVEHQHALRACRLAFVGQRVGNPESPLFAFDHELHAFGPALDDPVEGERGGLAAEHRAVEHRAVGFPTRIVNGHQVALARVCLPCAGRDDPRRQAGRGLGGVRRRRGDVGRRRRHRLLRRRGLRHEGHCGDESEREQQQHTHEVLSPFTEHFTCDIVRAVPSGSRLHRNEGPYLRLVSRRARRCRKMRAHVKGVP